MNLVGSGSASKCCHECKLAEPGLEAVGGLYEAILYIEQGSALVAYYNTLGGIRIFLSFQIQNDQLFPLDIYPRRSLSYSLLCKPKNSCLNIHLLHYERKLYLLVTV